VSVAERRPVPPARESEPIRLLLVGNPNSGKTTLFNRLCGLRAKTANFPGTTADLRIGRLQVPASGGEALAAEIVDLPGLYSLDLDLPESKLAAELLAVDAAHPPAGVVVVADATNLVRPLALAADIARRGVPLVVALNMIDLARRRGISFDLGHLSLSLGAPVVAVSARRGEGIDTLLAAVRFALERGAPKAPAGLPESGEAADLEAWSESVVAASVGGAHAVGSASDTLIDRLDATFTHPHLIQLPFFIF